MNVAGLTSPHQLSACGGSCQAARILARNQLPRAMNEVSKPTFPAAQTIQAKPRTDRMSRRITSSARCRLKLVSNFQELLFGVRLELSPTSSGHDSLIWRGVWHGARCCIKFVRSTSLTSELLSGLDLLVGQSHPFILQYYLARAVRVKDESWWRASQASREGPARMADGEDIPSTRSSMGIESLLGSTFLDTQCQEQDRMCRTEKTVDAILGTLRPTAGDYIIALVTELCVLGDVRRAISAHCFEATNKWSEHVGARAALCTAREVALGLLHLQLLGSYHGNLRPSQVLLIESYGDRRGFVAKLADAGLGCRHGGGREPHPRSLGILPGGDGTTAGAATAHDLTLQPPSATYIAPEVSLARLCSGNAHVERERARPVGVAELQVADVYAFGCLLYELLTSKPPPPSQTEALAGTVGLAPALQWPEGCDQHLRQLCCRCMRTDPRDRPSFATILSELNAIEARLRSASRAARCATSGSSSRQVSGSGGLRPMLDVQAHLRPEGGTDLSSCLALDMEAGENRDHQQQRPGHCGLRSDSDQLDTGSLSTGDPRWQEALSSLVAGSPTSGLAATTTVAVASDLPSGRECECGNVIRASDPLSLAEGSARRTGMLVGPAAVHLLDFDTFS